jgi:taurine dioxygenase
MLYCARVQISTLLKADGSPAGFQSAGRYWHSDMSYLARPVMASVMHAKIVPTRGGDTLFADMCRAYETLDPVIAAQIEGLSAVHSYAASFSPANGKDGVELAALRHAAEKQGLHAIHPVVRTHPETDRRALFVRPRCDFGTHTQC